MHLFDVDLAKGPSYQESRVVQAGTEPAVVPLPGTPFTAGLAICYDLRFPELFRALSVQKADLLLLPAAFTLTTGRDHWEVLVRARAIENQAYVIAPAQWGRHSPGGAATAAPSSSTPGASSWPRPLTEKASSTPAWTMTT